MRAQINFKEIEIFARKELKLLKGRICDLDLYKAGRNKDKKGGFNFYSRDLILSSILLKDLQLLKNSLRLCAILQGTKNNPYNGEEKGKIFHEYPEKKKTEKEGRNTGFNASDTTSLFIIGMAHYIKQTKDKEFLDEHQENIIQGLKYLLKHIRKEIFWEDPKFCNAKKFRLKSTYWKDTGFLGREDYKPFYPVAYSLVQAQVLSSLRAANYLLSLIYGRSNPFLLNLAKKMNYQLWTSFWDKESKNFAVGIDKKGLIKSNSSDYLHFLYYLDEKDVSKRKLKLLIKKSRELKTRFGYRGAIEKNLLHPYYSAIWPWEQGFIFLAGKKHKIKEITEISKKSLDAIIKLNCFPEVIKYFKGELKVMKYNTQLWTIAYAIFLAQNFNKDL